MRRLLCVYEVHSICHHAQEHANQKHGKLRYSFVFCVFSNTTHSVYFVFNKTLMCQWTPFAVIDGNKKMSNEFKTKCKFILHRCVVSHILLEHYSAPASSMFTFFPVVFFVSFAFGISAR